jgi:hypothetical protein
LTRARVGARAGHEDRAALAMRCRSRVELAPPPLLGYCGPVDLRFDLWHLAFVNLIQARAPPSFEILSEIRLSVEPQRADMVLLRRTSAAPHDDEARILRPLWPQLGLATVLEYKSPVDSAFRPGDLLRLVGYGVLYETAHLDELPAHTDLTLVLVVASVTPTLRREVERLGWTLTPTGGGYARIDGGVYACHVVITDEVTLAERDEYLRLFSHRPTEPGEATRWLRQWMREKKMKQPDIDDVPGWDEIARKVLDKQSPRERLAGLSPEDRTEGLTLKERLAGLSPEQVVLALPIDALRVIPKEYLRTLPVELQKQIKDRLDEAMH